MKYQVYSYRWIVVGAFWFLIFAYGANWFALSPMLTTFEAKFSIPPWQAHLLISLIGLFVVFFAWPAGSLIDKKGPKLSASIGGLLMMIGFGLRPWLLDSFATLMLSSIIAGVGLAWILVALAPQMLRWFPERQASLPIGIASSGLFIGFGTGSLLMPLIVDTPDKLFSGFLVFGVISVIAFVLWIVFAKDDPSTPPEERKKVEKMGFVEGMEHIFSSRNAYLYPAIGFLIVGITLVISAFVHFLYSGDEGGYIAGLLLYGCALGAFFAPRIAGKYGLKKTALSVVIGASLFWVILFGLYSYNVNWLLIVLAAFIFGFFFQASWPLALYSQETEEGVTGANVGIAASLYVSISNTGAAILPVVFGFLFENKTYTFISILAGLMLCILIWGLARRGINRI